MIHLKETDLIAYHGDYFTIEWYYDSNGKSDALDYFNKMSRSQKRKSIMLFKRICDYGKISDTTKFRNQGDKIYVFKPQPDRLLCFFYTGKKIIITSGYLKKSQAIPIREKDKALTSMIDYKLRTTQGNYYDCKS